MPLAMAITGCFFSLVLACLPACPAAAVTESRGSREAATLNECPHTAIGQPPAACICFTSGGVKRKCRSRSSTGRYLLSSRGSPSLPPDAFLSIWPQVFHLASDRTTTVLASQSAIMPANKTSSSTTRRRRTKVASFLKSWTLGRMFHSKRRRRRNTKTIYLLSHLPSQKHVPN
jgi:hypothetical protein